MSDFRHVIRDLDNLSQNDPSGDNQHCPDLTGALGPCDTLPLIVPLDVCRDFAGDGRLESGLPLPVPLPRPRFFDGESAFSFARSLGSS